MTDYRSLIERAERTAETIRWGGSCPPLDRMLILELASALKMLDNIVKQVDA